MKVKFYKQFFAADLDEAYKLGYFGSPMPLNEFSDRLDPQLTIKTNATHRGIFDTTKNKFICGVPRFNSFPQFNIYRWDKSKDRVLNHYDNNGEIIKKEIVNTDDMDSVMLARGWEGIFDLIEANGYKMKRR